MELNGIVASMPIIAGIVGVVSGTVTVLVHVLGGFRHIRERSRRAVGTSPVKASPRSAAVTAAVQPAPSLVIRTPDQRLRIFVSSTLQELAEERAAARQAISRLRLTPVLFELGARPHPPRDLYRAYLAQSEVFLGIYWQKYGWVAPGEDVSGLEDEYRLAAHKPKLIYLKAPAPDREPRLGELLDQVRADDHVSYKTFRTASELRGLIADDLALLITERFVDRVAADRPHDPAIAPAHADKVRTNLPIQTTSFVGRETELGEIKRLIESSRILTLTGAGGVGKTRLALQAAADVLESYTEGVWLTELAPVGQAELVPHVVARILNVREVPGQLIVDTLCSALQSRQLLLVLDNCEHVVDVCAELVGTLVRSCPALRIIATSRERLGVAGETTWRVPGLAVPQADRLLPLAQLANYAGVQLFIERARSVQPDFILTDQNAPAVADVCWRLEGQPLAIELAAARVRVLSVQQIASRLDDRFGLLTGGSRTALARQQTLRATIDWSYSLLREPEQAVFNRLGVFVGGWTLEAAEAVCTGASITATDALDLLMSLVDKSLVIAEEHMGTVRYRLLESIREYASQKLRELGEELPARERHCAWYLMLAEQAEPELRGAQQATWLAKLEREHDNLRAALTWTLERRDAESGLRLAGALCAFWLEHGHLAEGRKWLEEQLTMVENTSDELASQRAKVLNGAAAAAGIQGDYERASALETTSLALCRQLGDRDGIARALNNLGNVAQERGDYERSAELHEESLALRRALGDPRTIAWSLSNLGWVRHIQGDYAQATALYEEAQALSREVRDDLMIALTLLNLGDLMRRQGDTEQATALFRESLVLLRRQGEVAGDARLFAGIEAAEALEGFARVMISTGQAEAATRLLGAADTLRERMHAPVPATQRADYDQSVAAAREALEPPVFGTAWTAGRAMSSEQAIAYALEPEPLTTGRPAAEATLRVHKRGWRR